MGELEEYRKEIDKIDAELLSCFKRRMKISGKIGEYKKANNLSVTDSLREAEKSEKIMESTSADMAMYTKILYITIMDLGKDYQRRIISGKTSGDE